MKCALNYNALAKLLYCLLHFLFSDVPAVALVFLNSLLLQLSRII